MITFWKQRPSELRSSSLTDFLPKSKHISFLFKIWTTSVYFPMSIVWFYFDFILNCRCLKGNTISDSLEHATIWALWSTSLDAPIRLEKIKKK